MPRQKKQKSLSLQEHLSKYPNTVLQKALEELDNSLFWDIFKSYIQFKQRAFEVAALDLAGHTGKDHEAAKASGYAQACEDVADNFMKELRNILQGNTGVVEEPMPEEEAEHQ